MPGGRRGLQNRWPDTLCRAVGSIPTLSANFIHRNHHWKEVIAYVARADSEINRSVVLRWLSV